MISPPVSFLTLSQVEVVTVFHLPPNQLVDPVITVSTGFTTTRRILRQPHPWSSILHSTIQLQALRGLQHHTPDKE